MGTLKVTVLGSGTSQGVPVIACDCHVCTSVDPKDNRLRSSILLEFENDNYVIDSGPDFRQQLLREQTKSLRGVIFTHEHKDHVAGLDDVRAFNYRDKRDMEVYCTPQVEVALRREFHYVFDNAAYPGVPQLQLINFKNAPITLSNGEEIIPIRVLHYKLEVFGFRHGNFAYVTDAKTIASEEKNKLRGLEVLIVNCLRVEEHISHFNLEEVLALIDEIQPKQTYLTHISHLFGTHDEIEAMLPPNVGVAFDGMQLQF